MPDPAPLPPCRVCGAPWYERVHRDSFIRTSPIAHSYEPKGKPSAEMAEAEQLPPRLPSIAWRFGRHELRFDAPDRNGYTPLAITGPDHPQPYTLLLPDADVDALYRTIAEARDRIARP